MIRWTCLTCWSRRRTRMAPSPWPAGISSRWSQDPRSEPRAGPATDIDLTSPPGSSPEAPDRPTPMLTVAFKANKMVDVRRRRYRTRPERLGREIPLGHRDLPMTGIAREYLANDLRRHAAPPMFSRHEELRHIVLDAFAIMRTGVDQGEAGQPFLYPDQQRVEALVAPIGSQVRKRGIAALCIELEVSRAWRLDLGEIVDIKLQ